MASLLDGIRNEDMSRINEICEKVSFGVGETIFNQGDIAWDMYILRSGRVQTTRKTEETGRVKLGVEGGGSFLGEVGMLEDVPREFTAVALEEVHALKITKQSLDALQRTNLPLATRFYLALIRELNKKLRKLNALSSEIQARLA